MSSPPAQVEFHAEGKTFEDDHLIIYGNYNTVLGDHCTVIGDRNRVTGKAAIVIGDDNVVSNDAASIQGDGNTVSGTCPSVEGNDNTISANPIRMGEVASAGLVGSLVGAAQRARDAPATTLPSTGPIADSILRMFATPANRGRPRGVAKRPRVNRLSSTRVFISGPATNRISRGGGRGDFVAINGIQLPVGTRVLSQSSSVVELDPSVADDLVRQYGNEEQQQQQQQPSLRKVLEDIKDKDRQADDDEGDKQCIVCCDRKKNVALNPCGHVVTCGECAIGLLKGYGAETLTCPICSAEIRQAAFARL